MKQLARIGVIGGSGFYRLFEKAKSHGVKTPYGSPSSPITVGKILRRKVAFIARHGVQHQYPPHRVPYRANLWALHSLGVQRVLAPCAAGSLQPDVKPGDFVVCDQFVHFTSGRKDTYYDGPVTTHVSTADPYCPELRKLVVEAGHELGLGLHDKGTAVVIQGPRFSTRAESRLFREKGWEVINMTQYPEVVLARELEMCYVNISLITDYDVGLLGDPRVKPVTHAEVLEVFAENLQRLTALIEKVVPMVPDARTCECSRALEHARVEA